MKLIPSEDGVTHINVYSGGKTPVGRFLSNFTFCKTDSRYGEICSIEGLYHYNKIVRSCEAAGVDSSVYYPKRLLNMSGWKAQSLGREIRRSLYKDKVHVSHEPDSVDNEIIEEAIRYKLQWLKENNHDLYIEAVYHQLPYVHYYVQDNDKVIHHKHFDWLIDRIEAVVNLEIENNK